MAHNPTSTTSTKRCCSVVIFGQGPEAPAKQLNSCEWSRLICFSRMRGAGDGSPRQQGHILSTETSKQMTRYLKGTNNTCLRLEPHIKVQKGIIEFGDQTCNLQANNYPHTSLIPQQKSKRAVKNTISQRHATHLSSS